MSQLPPLRLPPLRLQDDACAVLRAHRAPGTTVGDVAARAAAAGASVVALTEPNRVDGFAPLALAAAELGIYAIPGTAIGAAGATVHGWLFDPDDEELRDLLAAAAAGERVAPDAGAAVIRRAGGVAIVGDPPFEALNDRDAPGVHHVKERGDAAGGVELEVVAASALAHLLQWQPLHSIQRDYFARLATDAATLTREQFAASLSPRSWRLERLAAPDRPNRMGRLDLLDAEPRVLPHRTSRASFVWLGPGSRHGARRLQMALRERGIPVLAAHAIHDWPEFVADVVLHGSLSPQARLEAMLRLELEAQVLGAAARRGYVLAYAPPPDARAGHGLAGELRGRLHGLAFHRVRWEGLVARLTTPDLAVCDPAPAALLAALAARDLEWAFDRVPVR
jgi:hypothetical protein